MRGRPRGLVSVGPRRYAPSVSPLLLLLACFSTPGDGAGDEHTGDSALDSGDSDSAQGESGDTHAGETGETDSGDTGDPPVPPLSPVLVYWTVDTLGATAADATSFCAALQNTVAPYGLDAACVDGGVSPSSWTLESSVRTHWPTHAAGAGRGDMMPACDDDPLLARVVHGLGGAYAVGIDNAAVDDPNERPECSGVSPWQNGADAYFWALDELEYDEQLGVGEESRPARLALEQLLEWSAKGGPAAAWLLDFEGGGHVPRCYDTPGDPACAAIWDYAVAHGYADAGDDPAATFTSFLFWTTMLRGLKVDPDRAELAEPFWDTTLSTAATWQDSLVFPRLRVLLDGLAAQGRLDDLQLVVYGDHGEAPCVDPLVGEADVGDCSHGEFPSEWTARVPVATVPASMAARWEAAGWIGGATEPWSTVRLAYATAADYGGVPDDWPEPEPVGQATSLACFDSLQQVTWYGLRVLGADTIRCSEGDCAAFAWEEPADEHDAPTPLADPPAALAALAEPDWGGDDWFTAACEGRVGD